MADIVAAMVAVVSGVVVVIYIVLGK